jgi:hypothetical protein
MSAHRKIRRPIIQSFRKNPRPLIDALVAANDVPAFDPASIRPYALACPDPVDVGSQPLGWQVDLIKPVGTGFVLLVDVITQLSPERVWTWLLWRTHARFDAAAPAWLMVCVTDDAVLTAVRKAFDHEPANMPMLISPDAEILALPSRPAPRAPVSFHV